jgi:hypothetical protein
MYGSIPNSQTSHWITLFSGAFPMRCTGQIRWRVNLSRGRVKNMPQQMILLVPLLGTPSEKSGGSDSSLVCDQRGFLRTGKVRCLAPCFWVTTSTSPHMVTSFSNVAVRPAPGLIQWLTIPQLHSVNLTTLEPNPMDLAPVFPVTGKPLHIAKFQMLFNSC